MRLFEGEFGIKDGWKTTIKLNDKVWEIASHDEETVRRMKAAIYLTSRANSSSIEEAYHFLLRSKDLDEMRLEIVRRYINLVARVDDNDDCGMSEINQEVM